MTNHLKGEVVLEAGGEKLTFRLGVNEMIAVQDALGLADDDAKFLVALSNLRSFKAVRTIVHCGLLRGQPDLTLERAGDIVTEIGMERVGEFIAQALRWALPEKKAAAGVEKRGDRPRPSVGPTSS